MPWTTSVSDLRAVISDGPTDHPADRKRCFGIINGSNTIFKTFEVRRLTNFENSSYPFGVFVGPTQLGELSKVATDTNVLGEFILKSAPSGSNTVVEATYYYQWFLDSELQVFLKSAAQWLGGIDYVQIAPGLQPAALNYAGHLAYKKLASRWSERMSQVYLLQDAPAINATKTAVDEWIKLAAQFLKDAHTERAGFYTRQDQSLAPLFGTVSGRIREITPPR